VLQMAPISKAQRGTGHSPSIMKFRSTARIPQSTIFPQPRRTTDWRPLWRVTEQEQGINFGVELWILKAALDPRLHSTLPAWTMRGRGTAAMTTRDLRASTTSAEWRWDFAASYWGISTAGKRRVRPAVSDYPDVTLFWPFRPHCEPTLPASAPAIRHSPVGWYSFPFVFFLSVILYGLLDLEMLLGLWRFTAGTGKEKMTDGHGVRKRTIAFIRHGLLSPALRIRRKRKANGYNVVLQDRGL